jgi:16S rRNA C967 or C1407 C5-methylase (RsmB/RsmF family)
MGKRRAKPVDAEREIKQRTDRPWGQLDKTHPEFIKYYCQTQGIVPTHEVDLFLEACRRPLGLSFRINTMVGNPDKIRQALVDGKFDHVNYDNEGFDPECKIVPPEPLPWYPNQYGWRVSVTKKQLKKLASLRDLRNFMLYRDLEGQINRQEIVSMIPPLLLDVQPGHVVWDACAAPGSKTCQIIDALHRKSGQDFFKSGMVIGNDASFQRAFMLSHQVNRLSTHCFVATNHEAQLFPRLYTCDKPSNGTIKRLYFDRILCDVPCTGDGTLRKNPDVWLKWNSRNSIGLHRMQVVIGNRAIDALKPGGLMVYSTCSMSPIEDEAVLAELLRSNLGKIELVAIDEKLDGLKRSPGLSNWKVLDPNDGNRIVTSMSELPASTKIKQSMFPPTEEEAKCFHLDRSIRVLPHHQDSGGFFIALIKKLESAAPPSEALIDVNLDHDSSVNLSEDLNDSKQFVLEDNEERPAQTAEKKNGGRRNVTVAYEEQPFSNVVSNPEGLQILQNIKNYFGISDNFKLENFFTRSEGSESRSYRMYLVSDEIACLLYALNDPRLLTFRKKINLVHSGVRVFEKTESHLPGLECEFRICQGSLGVMLPYISKQLMYLPASYFRRLIEERVLMYTDVCENEEILQGWNSVKKGSVIVYVRLNPVPLAATVWLSSQSIQLMVKKDAVSPLLSQLDENLV